MKSSIAKIRSTAALGLRKVPFPTKKKNRAEDESASASSHEDLSPVSIQINGETILVLDPQAGIDKASSFFEAVKKEAGPDFEVGASLKDPPSAFRRRSPNTCFICRL